VVRAAVKVRVSGELADVFDCIRMLTDAVEIESGHVLSETRPRRCGMSSRQDTVTKALRVAAASTG
jgi:hypothetical protein